MSRAYKSWTDEDIAFLKENHKNLSIQELSEALNRTERAVLHRTAILKLNAPPEWTEEKIEQLKKRFSLEPANRIANDLGFSRNEIYIKARQLRLKKKSVVWSEKELQYLEENFKVKPIQEICKVLKRTQAAVNLRAFVLGLKPKRRKSKLKKIAPAKSAKKRPAYVSIIPEELKNIRMYG